MQLSKIGSKNTYHKCIKQLHQAQYILYHPAVSKYQPVKISMIRLDTKEQQSTYTQLDLFSPKSGTAQVPNLTAASPNNDTTQVPDLGHSIKPNIKQERETPTQKIFKKNEKIQTAINEMAQVPKLIPVAIIEVHEYFLNNNYPSSEAKKFFNHYKALGWKIQGVTPIEDWKALVEKWMTNAAKWGTSPFGGGGLQAGGGKKENNPAADIKYLYEIFLEGKKFFNYISTEHFRILKLEISEEVMQQAWQERINQVSGTNQHSLIELWKAYLTNNPDNPLVQKDKPNLIALAKRIAVLNHFHSQKKSGIKAMPPCPFVP